METRHLVAGTLIALAIGGGYAWYQSQAQTGSRGEVRTENRSTDPNPAADTGPTLYKWQNDAGVWNYTDSPPKDRPYTTITGTPNVNSVPTVVPEAALDNASAEESQPPR